MSDALRLIMGKLGCKPCQQGKWGWGQDLKGIELGTLFKISFYRAQYCTIDDVES